jgi:hypothetical protein
MKALVDVKLRSLIAGSIPDRQQRCAGLHTAAYYNGLLVRSPRTVAARSFLNSKLAPGQGFEP